MAQSMHTYPVDRNGPGARRVRNLCFRWAFIFVAGSLICVVFLAVDPVAVLVGMVFFLGFLTFLYLKPGSALFELTEEGIHVHGPPDRIYPWSDIKSVTVANFDDVVQEGLFTRLMWGNGGGLPCARIELADRAFGLCPVDVQRFVEETQEHLKIDRG
jgi:hypothetical protein